MVDSQVQADGVRISFPPIARTVTNQSCTLDRQQCSTMLAGLSNRRMVRLNLITCPTGTCSLLPAGQSKEYRLPKTNCGYTLHLGAHFAMLMKCLENCNGSKLRAMLRSATRRIVVCWCPFEVYAPTQTRRIWSRMCHAAGS